MSKTEIEGSFGRRVLRQALSFSSSQSPTDFSSSFSAYLVLIFCKYFNSINIFKSQLKTIEKNLSSQEFARNLISLSAKDRESSCFSLLRRIFFTAFITRAF